MKSKIIVLLFITALLNFSCSKRILEGMEAHKLHDTYFILRKNGHYSIKVLAIGVFRMPDSERGRYLLSRDTVYFVNKKVKDVYETTGYGIIDSIAGTFSYRYGGISEWRIFDIRKIPTRREDRKNGR